MNRQPAPHAELLPGTPWHTGERILQSRAGVEERLAEVGPRVVRDYMPDQHREFFAMLPSIVIGAVAPDGQVWATLRAGQPGFLQSPNPYLLEVASPRDADDPADSGMEDGNAIALLGLDPMTRRRNRLNGTVRRDDARGFGVTVGQSFGNCPQYIQKREFVVTRDPATPGTVAPQILTALDARARGIREADRVIVRSALAELEVTVTLTERVAPGVVSLPHGFSETADVLSRQAKGPNCNRLIPAGDVDVPSATVALNGVSVRIIRVTA